MEISFEEIAIWCRNEKKRMWEFMLEEDMRDRKVTMEKSFAEMERIFEAMMDAINTYKGDRVSASGLVGGTGARLEQYFEQEDVLCGGYMGEAMVTALKMAESNACMRRIVAAPTAGSCGVIPAVLVPYYNRAMAGIESKIPVDEVIDAMKEVGSRMDHSLKETALGGLANTKTGIRLSEGINEAREEKVVDICEKSV